MRMEGTAMDSTSILGAGNTLYHYGLVLLVYAMMFLLIRFGTRRVELNFRRSYWYLAIGWGVTIFVGNYLCYLAGVMSFLPWLNNLVHTFLWIGLCLSFLYAGSYRYPMWEQMALCIIVSLIVKVAERLLLGTWEHPHFFGIDGNAAYIIGWSVMDFLYPVVSLLFLRLVGRIDRDVFVPVGDALDPQPFAPEPEGSGAHA
jgi:hypothetical protein